MTLAEAQMGKYMIPAAVVAAAAAVAVAVAHIGMHSDSP
jgi:hypothetical protein